MVPRAVKGEVKIRFHRFSAHGFYVQGWDDDMVYLVRSYLQIDYTQPLL